MDEEASEGDLNSLTDGISQQRIPGQGFGDAVRPIIPIRYLRFSLTFRLRRTQPQDIESLEIQTTLPYLEMFLPVSRQAFLGTAILPITWTTIPRHHNTQVMHGLNLLPTQFSPIKPSTVPPPLFPKSDAQRVCRRLDKLHLSPGRLGSCHRGRKVRIVMYIDRGPEFHRMRGVFVSVEESVEPWELR